MKKKLVGNPLAFLFSLSLLLTLAISCKAQKSTRKQPTKEKVEAREIEINPDYAAPDRVDFKIDSGSVKNGLLTLYVRYSGGCKEHNFRLIANNYIKKSLPPQTELFLEHDSNNDSCYRPLEKVIIFNLSKLDLSNFEQIILDVNHQVYINYQTNQNQPSQPTKK